eukprot:3372122-Pyramimonas_sp.AAC.1
MLCSAVLNRAALCYLTPCRVRQRCVRYACGMLRLVGRTMLLRRDMLGGAMLCIALRVIATHCGLCLEQMQPFV